MFFNHIFFFISENKAGQYYHIEKKFYQESDGANLF